MYDIGFVGFGEAAQAFTQGWRQAGMNLSIATYDVLFDHAATRVRKVATCDQSDVSPVFSPDQLAGTSRVIISAVTADQVEIAAKSIGPLPWEVLYFDINSA